MGNGYVGNGRDLDPIIKLMDGLLLGLCTWEAATWETVTWTRTGF